jgi:hypothetical protein
VNSDLLENLATLQLCSLDIDTWLSEHVSKKNSFWQSFHLQESIFDRDKDAHAKLECRVQEQHRHVNVSIVHYTYGQDFDEQGKHTYGKVGPWHWDKRDYGAGYPQLPIVRPANGTPETVLKILEAVEEAGFSERLWEWWRANMLEDSGKAEALRGDD